MIESAIPEVNFILSGLDTMLEQLNGSVQVQIDRGAGGREVALAITKLQEAKMWLLEALD